MVDKTVQRQARSGPFRLDAKFDEVGPDLGHLYASRHLPTGQPAVTLRPGERMHWLHRGPWRLVISCEHNSPDVSLRLDKAPPFAPPGQVADMLVLLDAAFQRVEDSPRLHAHFAAGTSRTRRLGTRLLVGAAVLALGLGVWWFSPARESRLASRPVAGALQDAPTLVSPTAASGRGLSYPLPQQPFRNQAKAPCRTQKALEVEINGGCWVELAEKPPCVEDRAEYEGKCYLPMAKERGRPPQSSGP